MSIMIAVSSCFYSVDPAGYGFHFTFAGSPSNPSYYTDVGRLTIASRGCAVLCLFVTTFVTTFVTSLIRDGASAEGGSH